MKEKEIKLCINDTLKLDGIVHVTGMVTCGSVLHRGKEKQAEKKSICQTWYGTRNYRIEKSVDLFYRQRISPRISRELAKSRDEISRKGAEVEGKKPRGQSLNAE